MVFMPSLSVGAKVENEGEDEGEGEGVKPKMRVEETRLAQDASMTQQQVM